MVESFSMDLDQSAVLIMDYQVGVVAMHATGSDAALREASTLLAAARETGIPVIYIQVGFRQDYPEVSRRNPIFSSVKQSGHFLLLDDPDTKFTRPSDQRRAILLW